MVSCTLSFEDNPKGIFLSGQQIKGTLELCNEKAHIISGLKVTLKGVARTSWSENEGDACNAKDSYLTAVTYLLGDGVRKFIN